MARYGDDKVRKAAALALRCLEGEPMDKREVINQLHLALAVERIGDEHDQQLQEAQ